jgi:hypothetical protein
VGVADPYMKAAEALLLSPGNFEAETGNETPVELYPLDKEKGGRRDGKSQIRAKDAFGAFRELRVVMSNLNSDQVRGNVHITSAAPLLSVAIRVLGVFARPDSFPFVRSITSNQQHFA